MKEGFEVVYAKRRSRQGESFLKKFTARMFYRILARITSVEIPVDTGDFRIMDRKIVDVLKRMPEQHKYLRGQISWVGFKQTFVEYDRLERHSGETGYTYKKMIRFALDGITSFSRFPLKVATMAGFIVSGIAFIIILYALYARFIKLDTVPGWTSIMLTVLFLGGIQLISIGIIGEYIGRLSDNVRNRPLYVIRETNTLKEE
jgi:dolichol-phosphate mannosyltransferase